MLNHCQASIRSNSIPEEERTDWSSWEKCWHVQKVVDWSPACEEAFCRLKSELLNCAVLAHPDLLRPFILSVAVSLDGLGVVLSQLLHVGD